MLAEVPPDGEPVKFSQAERVQLLCAIVPEVLRGRPTETPANKKGEKKKASLAFATATHAFDVLRCLEYCASKLDEPRGDAAGGPDEPRPF